MRPAGSATSAELAGSVLSDAAEPGAPAVGAVDRRPPRRRPHRRGRARRITAWSTGSPPWSWRPCCSTWSPNSPPEPQDDWKPGAAAPSGARRFVDRNGRPGERPARARRVAQRGSSASPWKVRLPAPARAGRALLHSLAAREPARRPERADLALPDAGDAGPPDGRAARDQARLRTARSTTWFSPRPAAAFAATWSATARHRPGSKAMVPVNVRDEDAADELGNRISFIFLELPCDEPGARSASPLRQPGARSRRKASGRARGRRRRCSTSPPPRRRCSSAPCRGWWRARAPSTSWCRTSPDPQLPMWMLGCRLREAYPIVPLADRHALSIGFTSVDGGALLRDLRGPRRRCPTPSCSRADIGDELDELRGSSQPGPRRKPWVA